MVEQSSEKEQMKAVVEYLNSKQSRSQALEIILGYSTTKQNRDLFEGIDICKQILRLLPEADCAAKACQCLINFSTDPEHIKTLISLNVAGRVFDYLKDNVKMNMESSDKSSANFNQDEMVYEIKQGTTTSIEYCVLLLCNISTIEEGQKHLIGEGKTKGLILDNLFGMHCYFVKNGEFDFIANVLSNIAGLKEGRQYMIDNKMLQKIVEMLLKNQVNDHRRQHLIECIRNIGFEYESNEQLFIDSNLIKDLIQLLTFEQGITNLTGDLAKFNAQQQKENINIHNTKNILDTLVLLANSDKMIKIMEQLKLHELLNNVNCGDNEDIMIQTQVLQNQIISLQQQPEEEENKQE